MYTYPRVSSGRAPGGALPGGLADTHDNPGGGCVGKLNGGILYGTPLAWCAAHSAGVTLPDPAADAAAAADAAVLLELDAPVSGDTSSLEGIGLTSGGPLDILTILRLALESDADWS